MLSIAHISRYKAASIHLALSAVIAALALWVMLALWYPPPLFKAMGGMELIVLIVGVDVAIGPLITLIIFNPRKKELLFDLSVVAVLQLAALCYGVYAMHAGRPVFTVFTGEHFAIAAAAEIDTEELAKASSDEFRQLTLTGPRLVAVNPPTDPEELSNIAFAALGGSGIEHLPRYYVRYADKSKLVRSVARPLSDLDLDENGRRRLDRFLAASGTRASELVCLPVKTKFAVLTAIIDARNGDLLSILDIEPGVVTH